MAKKSGSMLAAFALWASVVGVFVVQSAGVAGASSPADTPPTVSLTAPANDAVYRVGQSVSAAYTCSGATAVSSCVGDVANGAALNTSASGPHLFKVSATDASGNVTTVAHAYRVLPGSSTVIGPTDVGTLSGGPVNLDSAKATVKVTAPAANGGEVGVGDTIHVEWALYRTTLGFPDIGNNGPNPLVWTFPAPSNAVIDGAVTVNQSGLHGETTSNAHSGSGSTGLISVSPAVPSNASQVVVNFDDDSSPGVTGDGDGVLVHVGFNVKVTAPGVVTIPGFPALTGSDCLYEGLDCNSFSTSTGIGGPGISFQAVDTVAPAITITTPAHGAVIAPNTVTHADFTCTDSGGPAALCQGDVANGAAVDTSVSGPHQFHVSSSDAAGNLAQSWSTFIVSDPTVSVGNCASTFGFSCTLPVTLSNPSEKTITVHYATADGTASAIAGAYTPASGTLTFAPGTTSRTVPVAIPTTGGAGTFTLNLTAPSNATVGTGVGTGTITGPPPGVSIADSSVLRPASGTTPMEFTASLTAPSPVPVTVHYATTNGTATALEDYTATSGDLTIPAGQTTGEIDVPVLGNQDDSPARTFTVTLSAPDQATLGRSVATGTIGPNHLLSGCGPTDTKIQKYVCHVYLDVLGRAAEPSGKAYWVNLLNGGATRSHMGVMYFNTPEARKVLVDRLYVFYLGRHGDTAGVAYWAGRLQHGATPDDIRVLILSSGEYYARAGGTYNGYVSRLYTDVLRRTVDAGGSAYWINLLLHGTTRAAMSSTFLHTPEGRSAVVGDVYLRFLGRLPATSETTFWVDAFTHGKTEVSIDIQVVASNEYFNRA